MFSEYINVIHRRYSSMIEKKLERKLRLIGFKDEFNVVNIKTFINTNNIELTIENKPMLTIYKAIDYRTCNVLFEFTVTSSILKENDSYVLKTEILEKK